MNRCARCGGRMYRDEAGEMACLACGGRVYPEAVFVAAQQAASAPARRSSRYCPDCGHGWASYAHRFACAGKKVPA